MVGADTDQGTLHDTVTSVSTGTHHHHPAIDFQYHGTVDSGVDRSGRYQTSVQTELLWFSSYDWLH